MERLGAAEVLVEARVVDHVVPVGRAGRRLQDRRQVDVRDAEVAQVGQHRGGVVEAELRPQLQPVGAGRGPARVRARATSDDAAQDQDRARLERQVSPALADGRSSTSGAAVSSTASQRSPYASLGAR